MLIVAFTVAELLTRHWIVIVTVVFGARFVPVTLTVLDVVLADTVPAVELALSKSTARGKVSFTVQVARVAVPVFFTTMEKFKISLIAAVPGDTLLSIDAEGAGGFGSYTPAEMELLALYSY